MTGRGAIHLAVDQPSALGEVIRRTACGKICAGPLSYNRSVLLKDVTCTRCRVMLDPSTNPSSFKQAILKHYEESCK